jgi:hypothetical protein
MSIIRRRFVAWTCLTFAPFIALGDVGPAPPVNRETIKGVWEALSERDVRVFRLEITNDAGWLAIGLEFIGPMIFRLSKTEWEKDRVVLHFQGIGQSAHGAHGPDDATPYTAVLRLSGTAWSDPPACAGWLDGVFTLNPEEKRENAWRLRFIKTCPDAYLATISKLSIEAKQAIEQQKQTPK